MASIKISTLQSKVEFIILSLGGKPDQDAEENKRSLDEFEYTSQSIKSSLNTCKDKLKERTEQISSYGYWSKERILLDEEIKGIFTQCEDELTYLREVFKRYKEKNKRKVSQKELENRSKNIDLLRRNLNLLQDEFKEQANRMKKKAQTDSIVSGNNGQFINIFGNQKKSSQVKDDDSEENEDDEDRDLDDEEKDILKQFEENDKELEDIAQELVDSLSGLKGKAENIENQIKRQGELLKKTRAKAEDNESKLRQNNNQLKQALNKFKNGKQICLDLGLCILFMALLGVLLKMLNSKGYM